jgi:Uma2 family endonuclease
MSPARPKRFTVGEYEEWDSSASSTRRPVELLDGESIEMTAIGGDPRRVTRRLNRIVVGQSGAGYIVDVQNPLRLNDDSMPQPDLAVIRERTTAGGSVPRARTPCWSSRWPTHGSSTIGTANPPTRRRRQYPESWIIDVTARTIAR